MASAANAEVVDTTNDHSRPRGFGLLMVITGIGFATEKSSMDFGKKILYHRSYYSVISCRRIEYHWVLSMARLKLYPMARDYLLPWRWWYCVWPAI